MKKAPPDNSKMKEADHKFLLTGIYPSSLLALHNIAAIEVSKTPQITYTYEISSSNLTNINYNILPILLIFLNEFYIWL